MIPQILRERPLIFWSGLLGTLALIGMLVPAGWNPVDGQGLMDRPARLGAFSERVVAVDEALRDGESVAIDPDRRVDIHLYLGARRLAGAGDMSHDDMRRARDLLKEMHAQLAREQTDAARRAVREMWLDRIVEEIPRLDRAKVGRALRRLHDQIDAHVIVAEKPKKDG